MHRQSIEIIVIDDASEDESLEVLQEFAGSILLIKNSTNEGVSTASNLGIEASSGEYVMRVDSDDYLSHFSCSFLSQVLDNNDDNQVRMGQKVQNITPALSDNLITCMTSPHHVEGPIAMAAFNGKGKWERGINMAFPAQATRITIIVLF